MEKQKEISIREANDASNEGRIHFGQVVGMLMEAQVESYTVDYRAAVATYVLRSDETLIIPQIRAATAIGTEFDGDAVSAAILGAQSGEVMYPEFKLLTQIAGCVGYTVWLDGRQVVYYGRKGETHVEPFPDR